MGISSSGRGSSVSSIGGRDTGGNRTGFHEGRNPEMGGSWHRSFDMPGYGRNSGGDQANQKQISRMGLVEGIKKALRGAFRRPGQHSQPWTTPHLRSRGNKSTKTMTTKPSGDQRGTFGNRFSDPRNVPNPGIDRRGVITRQPPSGGRRFQDAGYTGGAGRNTLRGSSGRDTLGGSARSQAQGRQDERPTFRNAAGKKVPAGKVAAKAVGKLIYGGKLTRNQNLVVGKALKNMNQNQRRDFVNNVALRRGAGKNVNVVKKNLVKPIGRAIRVANKRRKNNK